MVIAGTGSHLLQTPAKMHDLLLDGLAQAEVDIQVPTVSVHRNLREFLTSHLETVVPVDSSYRLVAHPPILDYRASSIGLSTQSDREQSIGGISSAATVSTSYVKSQDSLRFSEYTAQLAAEMSSSAVSTSAPRRMLLAVGPEGGWVQQEVALFQQQAFQLVHLGPRILRGDIAVRTFHFSVAVTSQTTCCIHTICMVTFILRYPCICVRVAGAGAAGPSE